MVRVHRQHDDAGVRVFVADAPRGLDPVDLRHRHVHEHHVGIELVEQADRLLAVRGLADHVEALLDHGAAQALAEHLVVVDEHQPDALRGLVVISHGVPPYLGSSEAYSGSSQTLTAVPTTGIGVEVEPGADARRPLAHADDAVGVEPGRLALAQADAVVRDHELGPEPIAPPRDCEL